jgi:hypothetical protein
MLSHRACRLKITQVPQTNTIVVRARDEDVCVQSHTGDAVGVTLHLSNQESSPNTVHLNVDTVAAHQNIALTLIILLALLVNHVALKYQDFVASYFLLQFLSNLKVTTLLVLELSHFFVVDYVAKLRRDRAGAVLLVTTRLLAYFPNADFTVVAAADKEL